MAETPPEMESVLVNVASSMTTVPPVKPGPCSRRACVTTESVRAASTCCVWSFGASTAKAVRFVVDNVDANSAVGGSNIAGDSYHVTHGIGDERWWERHFRGTVSL